MVESRKTKYSKPGSRETNRHTCNAANNLKKQSSGETRKGPPLAFVLSLLPITIIVIILFATRREKTVHDWIAEKSKEDAVIQTKADEYRNTARELIQQADSSVMSEEKLREMVERDLDILADEDIQTLRIAAGKLNTLGKAHDLLVRAHDSYEDLFRKYEYAFLQQNQQQTRQEVRECQKLLRKIYEEAGGVALLWKREAEKIIRATDGIENPDELSKELDRAQDLLKRAATYLEILLDALCDNFENRFEALSQSISGDIREITEVMRASRFRYRLDKEE